MSDYAVVNPATGETIKEYPTITDDELRAAIGRADDAYRSWTRTSTVAERGVDAAFDFNPGLRAGLNVRAGEITHPAVAEALGLPAPA